MYNRYISHNSAYARAQETGSSPFSGSRPSGNRPGQPFHIPFDLGSLLGLKSGDKKNAGGLTGIFKALQLDNLDTGDILLMLILLFLFLEGDNTELVITLGLMLLLGLKDDDDQRETE